MLAGNNPFFLKIIFRIREILSWFGGDCLPHLRVQKGAVKKTHQISILFGVNR